MLKYSLGMDVSKSDFHCCLSTIDERQMVKIKGTHKFSNTLSGFKMLREWVVKRHKEVEVPLVVTMEATGSYYEQLALYLSDKGFYVSVVLPNKAKNYILALGLKSKNDKMDAKGLARMGAEQNLEQWSPMSKYFYQLRSLTRQYQNLKELETVINNQLEALEQGMYKTPVLFKQQKSLLAKIQRDTGKIKKAIEDHITSNEEVHQKVDKICKIKGVGLLTVAVVVAETNGFELFRNTRQLVSYAGYDVVESQSGTHAGKTRISKKGNSRIRRALHMPSLCVVTYPQRPFIGLFNRTYERHRIKMKSYVAVQKKLLVIIYTLWRKNETYIENYNKNGQHTTETEQEPASLHGLEQAKPKVESEKDSTNQIAGAIQGQHTVEISQSAASLQL